MRTSHGGLLGVCAPKTNKQCPQGLTLSNRATDLAPILSTKAAVYSGIISNEVPMIRASCETANCSWPVIPTLAACGGCATIDVATRCNKTTNICTYSTSKDNSIDTPADAEGYSSFKVSPTNGTVYPLTNNSRAYLSVFDILLLDRAFNEELEVTASQCALWFCIQAFSIKVNEGVQNQTAVGNWYVTLGPLLVEGYVCVQKTNLVLLYSQMNEPAD